MSISTEILIPGRPQAVWNVLTDLTSYASWNPFIRTIEGPLEQGARWRMELTIDGRVFFPVPIRITRFEPNRQLSWRGGIPTMMTGLHGFGLTETADFVKFEQSESFSGVLVPVVFPMLKAMLRRRFVAMNEALKAEVVRRSRS